jgi:chromosome segregation ATPase
MSILNLGGMSKEGGSRRLERLLGNLDRDKVRDVADRVLEGTRTIGERHESINSAIEDAGHALGQLRVVEEGLERARRALEVEFETRREERSENVALNALIDHYRQELTTAGARESELLSRLNAGEVVIQDLKIGKASAESDASGRQAEITRLNASFNSARAEAGELRALLDQASKQLTLAKDDNGALHVRLDEAESRRQEAEAKTVSLTQTVAMIEAERGALERRAESQTTETARLGRAVAELEGRLSAEQTRSRTFEAAAQAAEAAAARLGQAIEEQAANTKVHLETADMRLETSQARASRLEAENADLNGRIQEASAKDRSTTRELADTRQWLERSEERVRGLEGDLTSARQELSAAEAARSAAVDRAERLNETLSGRQSDIVRMEDQSGALQQRITALEDELSAERASGGERVRALNEVIERERSEHSIAQGALDAVRKDRARLHLELLKRTRRAPGPDEVLAELDASLEPTNIEAKAAAG